LPPPPPFPERPSPARGVYGISVAAELVGSAPQNLRLYEARGLLNPDRSDGGTRRYSDDDLDRLREIGRLLGAGLNLAGVSMVLILQDANEALRAELDQLTRPPRSGRRRQSSTDTAPDSRE
jgi:MerR family transcriptional regulator/heat shock protein HspR